MITATAILGPLEKPNDKVPVTIIGELDNWIWCRKEDGELIKVDRLHLIDVKKISDE